LAALSEIIANADREWADWNRLGMAFFAASGGSDGERFFQEFTLRQVLLNAAKNACGPSAAGTSSRAEGPNIVGPAATTASPAPAESPVSTDGSALTASTP
jgi:hypothetical protein